MKAILPVSIFILFFIAHTDALANAPAGEQYITLYKDHKFRGERITVAHSWSALESGDPWNDNIESIRVPDGWEVWAFEHSYFRGNHMVITSDWDGRSNRRWRDCISSIKVVRRSGYTHGGGHPQNHYHRVPVTIFEDDNFDGAAMRIGREWTTLNSDDFWNDRISSIYVPDGFRVIIYEHSYFRGRSMVLDKSWSAPRGKNWWNDQVSSIRVERK